MLNSRTKKIELLPKRWRHYNDKELCITTVLTIRRHAIILSLCFSVTVTSHTSYNSSCDVLLLLHLRNYINFSSDIISPVKPSMISSAKTQPVLPWGSHHTSKVGSHCTVTNCTCKAAFFYSLTSSQRTGPCNIYTVFSVPCKSAWDTQALKFFSPK